MLKQLRRKSTNSAALKAASCSTSCLVQVEGLAELFSALYVSLPAHVSVWRDQPASATSRRPLPTQSTVM